MFNNRVELVKYMMLIVNITLISYVQVPVASISILVSTFFKHFVCLGIFIIFCFFFITQWLHWFELHRGRYQSRDNVLKNVNPVGKRIVRYGLVLG